MATVDQFQRHCRRPPRKCSTSGGGGSSKAFWRLSFGIAAWAWPELTLATLIWILGAYIVADGIMDIIGLFTFGRPGLGPTHLAWLWGSRADCRRYYHLVRAGYRCSDIDGDCGNLASGHGDFHDRFGIYLRRSPDESHGFRDSSGVLGAGAGVYMIIEPGDWRCRFSLDAWRCGDRLWNRPDSRWMADAKLRNQYFPS